MEKCHIRLMSRVFPFLKASKIQTFYSRGTFVEHSLLAVSVVLLLQVSEVVCTSLVW